MFKNIQLTLALTISFIVLCISAIILNLHTWSFTANQLGYNEKIYYRGRVSACNLVIHNENQKEYQRIYELYETQIRNGEPFPEKQTFDTLDKKFNADYVLIELFSDSIFIVFSFVGLIVLWGNRKRVGKERQAGKLRLYTWLFILIALYCHWFIMQFVFKLIEVIMGLPPDFTPWINWLADHFHISGWFFLSFNCLIGLLVLGYITFRIVPRRQLIPFLVSGLAGGILSRLIWYSWLGPIVMPHP